jgi:dephospho-CoA kinase
MIEVALTGNIASGKTTVAGVWASLGAPVIDADELARRAVEPGSRGLEAIVRRWGGQVLDEGGALDRGALREIVFRDSEARGELGRIIHPEVARLRGGELERLALRGEPVAVLDIPLLFEVGLQDRFDLVVLVDAPEQVRRQRLIRDRGLTAAEADRMIAAQIPSEAKRRRADVTIDNDGTREQLERRAAEVWRWIQGIAADRDKGE